MTLEELIEEGPKIKAKCYSDEYGSISGEEYSTWLMNCCQKLQSDIRYLHQARAYNKQPVFCLNLSLYNHLY